MAFSGINIGHKKTIVATTTGGGSIMLDVQGNREFPTIFELSTPIRNFGGKTRKITRRSIGVLKRNFENLATDDDIYNYSMYVFWLKRGFRNINYVFTYPITYGFSEMLKFSHIINSDNSDSTAISDIMASAFFIYYSTNLPKFSLLDFGHGHTTFGVFEVIEGVLQPLLVSSVPIGGSDVDKGLLKIVYDRYNVVQSDIVEIQFLEKLELAKKCLGSVDTSFFSIDTGTDYYQVELSRDDLYAAGNNMISNIKDWLYRIIDGDYSNSVISHGIESVCFNDIPLEVTGCASSGILVREFLSSLPFELKYTCNINESAAIGAAIAAAFEMKGKSSPHIFKELLLYPIYLRKQGDIEFEVVAERGSLIPSVMLGKTYKKKVDIVVEFFSEEGVLATVNIPSGTHELKFKVGNARILEVFVDGSRHEYYASDFIKKACLDDGEAVSREAEYFKAADARKILHENICAIPTDIILDASCIEDAKRKVVAFGPSCNMEMELRFQQDIMGILKPLTDAILKIKEEKTCMLNQVISKYEHDISLFIEQPRSIYMFRGKLGATKAQLQRISVDLFGFKELLNFEPGPILDELERLNNMCQLEEKLAREAREAKLKAMEDVTNEPEVSEKDVIDKPEDSANDLDMNVKGSSMPEDSVPYDVGNDQQ